MDQTLANALLQMTDLGPPKVGSGARTFIRANNAADATKNVTEQIPASVFGATFSRAITYNTAGELLTIGAWTSP